MSFSVLALVFALAGCGQVASPSLASRSVSVLEAQRVPTNFTVLRGKVIEVLPEDTQGLRHQCFTIRTDDGETYEVNHSVSNGERIDNLHVGVPLSIRGVVYRDRNKQGIHWTHHASRQNDAGWIEIGGKRYH